MNHKQAHYAEYRLYLGSIKGEKGPTITESQLIRVVQDYQVDWNDKCGFKIPVRLTKTAFVCVGYIENGWELVVFNYPRDPRPTKELEQFIKGLQSHLIIECEQSRITVVYDSPDGQKIEMAEREEISPCCQ